jgi:hypothetical protein
MNKVRHIIAVGVVAVFLIVVLSTTGMMIFGAIAREEGLEILKLFSSIVSGFVGVVFGYYFGQAPER